MSESSEKVTVRKLHNSPNVPELRIEGHGVRPSWRTHGLGGFHLDLVGHTQAKWLTLHAEAWAYAEKGKPTVRRSIMLTLDEATARAVYAYLHELYGDDAPRDAQERATA